MSVIAASPPVSPSNASKQQQPMSSSSPPRKNATLLECDYDKNPTYLYQAIEARQWDHARKIFHKADSTEQVSTWVIRKEVNGQLRWRLLPIHACIIFQAPLDVIELVLEQHPLGAQCKDDQGMLPLHLAFRNEADWEVLEELLTAYPQAIHVKDRKGRLPTQCASQKTAKRASVLELYTQIAVSLELHRSTQEARNMLETRVVALQDTHVKTLQRLKSEWEEQLQVLAEELARTKSQLQATEEALDESTQQLASKSDLEGDMALKMRQVGLALEAVNESRAMEDSALNEARLGRERALMEANDELATMVQDLLDQQTSVKMQLDKQAWESKDKEEKRLAMWNELRELYTDAEQEDHQSRDLLRAQLQVNIETNASLMKILETTKQDREVPSVGDAVPEEVSTASANAQKNLDELMQDIHDLEIKPSGSKSSNDPPANTAVSESLKLTSAALEGVNSAVNGPMDATTTS